MQAEDDDQEPRQRHPHRQKNSGLRSKPENTRNYEFNDMDGGNFNSNEQQSPQKGRTHKGREKSDKMDELDYNHQRRSAVTQNQNKMARKRNSRYQNDNREIPKEYRQSRTSHNMDGKRNAQRFRERDTSNEKNNQNQQMTEFDDAESQGSQVFFQSNRQEPQDRPQNLQRKKKLNARYDQDQDLDAANQSHMQQQDTEGNFQSDTDYKQRDFKQPKHTRNQSNPVSSTHKSKKVSANAKNSDKLAHGLNWEPEFTCTQTLNERAIEMVRSDEYLNKVKMIKGGNQQIKSMEFIMDGIKIELPYLGAKLTQGYLRKETQSVNLLMQHQFQTKFCMLDLTKFLFKYAKAPTDKFVYIHLKDIIDVTVEPDPGVHVPKQPEVKRSMSLFSGGGKKEESQGFNFQVKTSTRVYRMQAQTKTEQIMWLRALTILFELRARVSQNLKTTIDINHHLYDNRMRMSEDEYDSLVSSAQGMQSSIEAMVKRPPSKQPNKGTRNVNMSSKLNEKQALQKKRAQKERKSLNESQKEIDELSIDSVDIDNVNLHGGSRRRKQEGRPPTAGERRGRPPLTSGKKNDAAAEDSVDDQQQPPGRQGRFEKAKTQIKKDDDDNLLEDYPDTTMKKPPVSDASTRAGAVRSKSQLLEAKKQEIARRIEQNKRLMEKTKQLSEFQKDLDLTSVSLGKNFANVQKDATADILKEIEKKKEALQEAAKEKESKINEMKKQKTQAIDLNLSSLNPPEKKDEPLDEEEYYDEEDYDDEVDKSSPVKSPAKFRPKEAALLRDLDDMLAPQRIDDEEPEIQSPVQRNKAKSEFVAKLIEKQERADLTKSMQISSNTFKQYTNEPTTFEHNRRSMIPENNYASDKVKMTQLQKVIGNIKEKKYSLRNESASMSGSELLRHFKQTTHQSQGQQQPQQLTSDNPLNKSGIFDMNKKKLKIIRNVGQTPTSNVSFNFNKEQTEITSQRSQSQISNGPTSQAAGKSKIKIKTVRLSQNAKDIIRQAKQKEAVQPQVLAPQLPRPPTEQPAPIQKFNNSIVENNKMTSSFKIQYGKNTQSKGNLNQTVVEVLKPQIEVDEDDGLGDWAGQIGMQNKSKMDQRGQVNQTQVIQFYDNDNDKDKDKSVFENNNSMILQDIDDEEDDIQIQNMGKSPLLNQNKELKSSQKMNSNINDFLEDDVPELKSPNQKGNIIKDSKHTGQATTQALANIRKKDIVKPNKDFQEILSQKDDNSSFLDHITKAGPFDRANNITAIEQSTSQAYGEDKNDNSILLVNQMQSQTFNNRDSWVSQKRGRKSVVDDNKSEYEKKKERQNSRKRNMLENSHHLHLSSSRKSITMQGQSSITHSVTREKEGAHDSGTMQNRKSNFRPPSTSGRRENSRKQDSQMVITNDNGPPEEQVFPQIGRNFKLPKQMNSKQTINIKSTTQEQPENDKFFDNQVPSDYFNKPQPQNDDGIGDQQPQDTSGIGMQTNGIEKRASNVSISTTHVDKQVVNNYYILNVNSQASIDYDPQGLANDINGSNASAKSGKPGPQFNFREQPSQQHTQQMPSQTTTTNVKLNATSTGTTLVKSKQEPEDFDYDW